MSLVNPVVEAFVAVAKYNTVHRAAKEIGLTQTGVTQRIRSLEKIVGVTLFTRSRKGMVLTAEGEILFHEACQLLEYEGGILSKFDSEMGESLIRVNISSPSSVMRSRVIPSLNNFSKRYKNIIFTFEVNDHGSSLADLKMNRVQLSVISRDDVVDEVDTRLLNSDDYILVGPYSWRKRDIKEVIKSERIVDFNQQDDFTLRYLKSAKLSNKSPKERFFVNNIDGLVSFVEGGNAFSVLPLRFATEYIDSKRLVNLYPSKKMKIDYALAWYPRHEMPAYFREIIDCIYKY